MKITKRNRTIIFLVLVIFIMACKNKPSAINQISGKFNTKNDLLLVQLDCKSDVDDIQTAAALATLISCNQFSNIHFHIVTGTYGTQDGLYVPPNKLLQQAFNDNWTDAHENYTGAVNKISRLIETVLKKHGDIWIAEAGQSDFTSTVVKHIHLSMPQINLSKRIHVIQHSDWNESVTRPENLQFVKKNCDYHKIPDGNIVGNGTPGFRNPTFVDWQSKIKNPRLIQIWQTAINLCNDYNGKENRYLNEAISAGGLDFSDLSEVCWILGLQNIKDTDEFFDLVSHCSNK